MGGSLVIRPVGYGGWCLRAKLHGWRERTEHQDRRRVRLILRSWPAVAADLSGGCALRFRKATSPPRTLRLRTRMAPVGISQARALTAFRRAWSVASRSAILRSRPMRCSVRLVVALSGAYHQCSRRRRRHGWKDLAGCSERQHFRRIVFAQRRVRLQGAGPSPH